jgi:hypothetical protein
MKLLLIDERDCFGLIQKELEKDVSVELLEPRYYIAPNPEFFEKMVNRASLADLVIIHRAIWTDECDRNDKCVRLDEFVEAIYPIPVLRVGSSSTNHESCPGELLDVYKQIAIAHKKLGAFIGQHVRPVNSAWRHTSHLVIDSLEMIGDNIVGCGLRIPQNGDVTKYYRLVDLQPA